MSFTKIRIFHIHDFFFYFIHTMNTFRFISFQVIYLYAFSQPFPMLFFIDLFMQYFFIPFSTAPFFFSGNRDGFQAFPQANSFPLIKDSLLLFCFPSGDPCLKSSPLFFAIKPLK